MDTKRATLDQDRETATAREFDAYARPLVFQRPSERETVCVIRWHDQDYFGADAIALLQKHRVHLSRLRPFLELAEQFRDIWHCLGKDVVVEDPRDLDRVAQFAQKGRRLKVSPCAKLNS